MIKVEYEQDITIDLNAQVEVWHIPVCSQCKLPDIAIGIAFAEPHTKQFAI